VLLGSKSGSRGHTEYAAYVAPPAGLKLFCRSKLRGRALGPEHGIDLAPQEFIRESVAIVFGLAILIGQNLDHFFICKDQFQGRIQQQESGLCVSGRRGRRSILASVASWSSYEKLVQWAPSIIRDRGLSLTQLIVNVVLFRYFDDTTK
jgi:hypothetical protein